MPQADFFYQKAAQCRRLAHEITARGDPARETLLKMAEEFDAEAVLAEGNETSGSPLSS